MKLRALSTLAMASVTLVFLASHRNSAGMTRVEDASRAPILAVLAEQQAAWNRGDVDEFMKGYWNSPEVSFAGSSGVTRGYEAVLTRYRKNYPDTKAMGHLEFSEVEVRPLGKDAAFVLGRWHLTRESGESGGVFTLVFQRFAGGWKIVHDHTSLNAKTPQSFAHRIACITGLSSMDAASFHFGCSRAYENACTAPVERAGSPFCLRSYDERLFNAAIGSTATGTLAARSDAGETLDEHRARSGPGDITCHRVEHGIVRRYCVDLAVEFAGHSNGELFSIPLADCPAPAFLSIGRETVPRPAFAA